VSWKKIPPPAGKRRKLKNERAWADLFVALKFIFIFPWPPRRAALKERLV